MLLGVRLSPWRTIYLLVAILPEKKNEDFIFIFFLISKGIVCNKNYLGIGLDQEGAVGWPTSSSLT